MIWDLFLSSFLLSVVLTGIHAYLGREIIKRGIVFADLAVAQFSGVGMAFSLLFFHGEHLYLFSLLFGLLASLLIALSQKIRDYSEAFVGLMYAFGFSLAVLLLSFSPHGMEELKKLTASDVLFVKLEEVLKTAVLYAFVGALLYLRKGLKKPVSELSFFALFSLTLASSVKLAGVLVVFVLLVGPALVSLLLNRGLAFAWAWGVCWSFLAVVFSFWLDFPTGYAIVFFQSLAGLGVFVFRLARS
ncbi:MAG: metal ABC transporter permease [Aquificaceae bacterium]|nr:metal ABC transporter permease [Aquificaceae bacterium]MCX8059993.1 metal ABC transporter permease [Aquificaceae bacterium]MDW8096846.1 metal ABC transporter permease [Aquificaceae bacterium]